MAKLTDIQIRAWIKAGERLRGAQTVIGFICATEQGIKSLCGASGLSTPGSRGLC